MSRFSVVGFRAGETIVTSAGAVTLHPVDRAADLSAEQVAWFERSGMTLAEVPPLSPAALVPQPRASAPEGEPPLAPFVRLIRRTIRAQYPQQTRRRDDP